MQLALQQLTLSGLHNFFNISYMSYAAEMGKS